MIRDLPLRLATAALAGLLLWAPLPFASVTYTARSALQAGCALVLLLTLLSPESVGRGARAPALALLLVALWGGVQAAPLPVALTRLLSPRTVQLRTLAAGLVPVVAPSHVPLSLAADLSRRNAPWWAAMAAVLLAAATCGRVRNGRRVIALGLLSGAAAEIVYGARRWTADPGQIWGVTVPSGGDRLRGTYVNPDHLALLLELSLAVVLAALWWSVRRARDAQSLEGRILLVAPALLAWLGIFASIAFTGSRAGLLAACTATAAQAAAAALRRRSWKVAPAGLGLLVLGIGTVAALGLQQGLGRWLATSPYELTWNARQLAYAGTLELWRRFPLTGTGMASFRAVFPMVQDASIPGSWWHAHNDWLEALATLGIPGALLLLAGLVLLVQRLFRILLGDNRSEDRAAALAGYGALVAAAVHSALDFGLTIPANALSLAVVVGAAAGTPTVLSRGRRGRRSESADPPPGEPAHDAAAAAPAPRDADAP
jgi:O-antigen ligase